MKYHIVICVNLLYLPRSEGDKIKEESGNEAQQPYFAQMIGKCYLKL